MKRKNLLLTCYASFMMLCSISVMGQSGVLLPDLSNVNNDFGAGESSTILGNNIIDPTTSGAISPGTAGKIRIGGNNSKNQVIRVYNGNGYGIGWVSVVRMPSDSHDQGGDYSFPATYNGIFDYANTRGVDVKFATSVATMPSDYLGTHYNSAQFPPAGPVEGMGTSAKYQNFIVMSFNSFNTNAFSGQWGTNAPCQYELFENSATGIDADGSSLVKVWHHQTDPMLIYQCDAIVKPGQSYTTTMGPVFSHKPGYHASMNFNTDEVNLTQFKGTAMQDAEALNNQKVPESVPGMSSANDGASKWYIDNYTRPTTIAIAEGNTTLDTIVLENVNWKYEVNYVDVNEVSSYSGLSRNDASCNSGKFRAYAFEVSWDPSTHDGNTHPDAAVQLIDGAKVCVNKGIIDNTGNIGEIATEDTKKERTHALMVWPFKDRFSLRTKGDFHVNLYNERNTATTSNLLYKTDEFPNPNAHVYLMHSTATTTKTDGYTSPLFAYDNGGAIKIAKPYSTTDASIFGVFGSYDFAGKMAEVHTLSELDGAAPSATTPPGSGGVMTSAKKGNSNKGIIEIGDGFAIGPVSGNAGYGKFHIYSGGTLKNFESCNGPTNNFSMNFTTVENTPNFYLDTDATLFILNAGNNSTLSTDEEKSKADINWHTTASITKLEDAIKNSIDVGALHMQAAGDIHFYEAFSPNVANASYPTEIRLLSDFAGIQFLSSLNYVNTSDTNFVAWVKGNVPGRRSCYTDTIRPGSGEVLFDGKVSIEHQGKGKTLLRSEYDDVFIRDNFTYANTNGPINGEFIMQAGQDIYGSNVDGGKKITFNQTGEKAILLEAKKTIHTKQDLIYNRAGAKAGNIILKAGYNSFSDSANISLESAAAGRWDQKGDCVTPSYSDREACGSTLGGDIWFEGDAIVNLSVADTIQTVLRAWNSIYIDSSFIYDQLATSDVGGNTLLYAEQGNIEAIVDSVLAAVSFKIDGATDESELRLQAGNRLWDEGGINDAPFGFPTPTCYNVGEDPKAEFDGNILFNKPLTINHKGIGYTLISSGRDIENQIQAPFEFTYDNLLVDSFYMTAGRHIETHAMVRFNHGGTNANIVMQAGRLNLASQTGSDIECKAIELGTSLTENDHSPKLMDGTNAFAAEGAGQGSILLFDSVEFNYDGDGRILMTALNGNIESDPYLHRNDSRQNVLNATTKGYDGAANLHNAPIIFNHKGTGITRLEAIDIKLHDKIAYYGDNTADKKNGQLYIHAFDSILTRNFEYINAPQDTGSVFIITDKLKRDPSSKDRVLLCGDYDATIGGKGINHGNIVLGYGADCDNDNYNDSIIFDFTGNSEKVGANVIIRAGYDGFYNNPITGLNAPNLFNNHPNDKGKGYGGNITFDFMIANMADGGGTKGGYMEISTPNGNIWGKDSLVYSAKDGDLLVDAGLGSLDDTLRAVRWSGFDNSKGAGTEKTLNTKVPFTCGDNGEWRTGNIMMKGATLDFRTGTGNATFRTREGFIDTYDAFTVTNMTGHLLKYAAISNGVSSYNQWGDVSERDFQYTPSTYSGSVFFGADDNIMLNYGYSNKTEMAYDGRNSYDVTKATSIIADTKNPFYSTDYMPSINECRAIFDVNENGYMWYRHQDSRWPHRTSDGENLHILYRGCDVACSPLTGVCETSDNRARDLTLDFSASYTGGFASVATNFIDVFTKFDYFGGQGSGLGAVPGMGSLHGENVQGYGLYMKSQFNGVSPEKRRATCEGCGDNTSRFPIQGRDPYGTSEWTYIGFHDDARIQTHNQKSLLEAPVIEFFGHAELNADTLKGPKTDLTLKADSLIFHDSAIFDGSKLSLVPYTTGAQRTNDMRYGVINDDGSTRKHYDFYGPAIEMEDHNMPVIEFGYQRCVPPTAGQQDAPNARSKSGLEGTPSVGGDIIVAFKHDFSLPILNTVVANHARISFIADSIDGVQGGKYVDACVRTELLRIRNKVEFYTHPDQVLSKYRKGVLKMTTREQMPTQHDAGIYPFHVHLEPNSELSIPGEDTLIIVPSTTIGGYGNVHENVYVEADGILAPGYASLMESDCQTGKGVGSLTTHNLTMEQDAVFRVSYDGTGTDWVKVEDKVFTFGIVPVYVLIETEYVEEGCYLIMEYGDKTGVSKEYVKNLKLVEDRYEDTYFNLDFSETGKVYLCVSRHKVPSVRRYVRIPQVDGVTTNPSAGDHFVEGSNHFSFTATFSGDPLKVSAEAYYSKDVRVLDESAEEMGGNTYKYTILRVVEPWHVSIGPETSSVITSNDDFQNQKVWSYKNTLYVNTEGADVVSIYTVTGVLYRKYEVQGGLNKYQLERGIYMVMLSDGITRKVIIK